MKSVLLVILFLMQLIPIENNAQHPETEHRNKSNLKQINFIFDRQQGNYFFQYIDQKNIKLIHRFQINSFNNRIGITQYHILNTDTKRDSKKLFGLTDTSGTILIPCIYEKLESTENPNFFRFYTKDSFGVLSPQKGEISKYPKISTQPINNKSRSKFNSFIYNNQPSNYAILRMDGLQGVYSYLQEKLVVPCNYDQITLHGDMAIGQRRDSIVYYHCQTGEKSQFLKEIQPLNNYKYFYIKFHNDSSLICTNPADPLNSDYHPLAIDRVLEFHNQHLIAVKSGKFGLKDEFGNLSIPFVYEDIFFLDKDLLLVKKDYLWAISNFQNQILTSFQFQDVEKQNLVNFNNFLQFSHCDTSQNELLKFYDYESTTGKTAENLGAEIKKSLLAKKRELNSRKISNYDISAYPTYVLKSDQGFQLIQIAYKSQIKIDSLHWDNVFISPRIYDYPFEIGVQKRNKFGYYDPKKNVKSYLKYDGLYFNPALFFYENLLFSGTHNEQSPFAVVKNGTIYSRSSLSKTDWLKKLTNPPNWPSRYQEKPKWRKVEKKVE